MTGPMCARSRCKRLNQAVSASPHDVQEFLEGITEYPYRLLACWGTETKRPKLLNKWTPLAIIYSIWNVAEGNSGGDQSAHNVIPQFAMEVHPILRAD